MEYTITINQKAIVEAGLHTKTDLCDWAIVDYIASWLASPSGERDPSGGYVWINYKQLVKNMPMLGIDLDSASVKKTVSHRIKKLELLGILEGIIIERRKFIRISSRTHEVLYGKMTRITSGNDTGVTSGNDTGVTSGGNSYSYTNDHNTNDSFFVKNIDRTALFPIKENEQRRQEPFKKPTVEEVRKYCKERENGIDAEKFWNFYESKGWMIGKNKMKNWKSAIGTWVSKEREEKLKKEGKQKSDVSEETRRRIKLTEKLIAQREQEALKCKDPLEAMRIRRGIQ